jgi:arylsulfatase A-like enzyme
MVGAHGCIGKSIAGCFDDLVRIPLLMRLPGRIEPGAVIKQPVSQIDFMPTILDFAGIAAPEKIHGESLRPLIEGRKVAWRDYAFAQRANNLRMLRTEQYKYVASPDRRIVALYDLQNDPNEDHNLAAEPKHEATLVMMHKRLIAVMARDGDPLCGKYRGGA